MLVAARSETRIPVSCVEEGRWHTRSAAFAPARHHAYPELRRRKAEWLAADQLALGAAQAAVWDEVRAKSGRLRVDSPTMAQKDIYDARGDELAALRDAFPLQPGQLGAVLALDGNPLCLEYVSRPDAFTRHYPKLLDGYLLDAIESLDGRSAAPDAFLAAVAAARRSRRPSAGSAEDVRLHGERVVGSRLELEGELIQLSAFTSDHPGEQRTIARPSPADEPLITSASVR